MGLSIKRFFSRIFHEKLRDGSNWYFVDGDDFSSDSENLEFAYRHPILTPAILFVTRLAIQGECVLKTQKGRKIINHEFLDLINKPNPFQTKQDFVTQLIFEKIANGVAVIYKNKGVGLSQVDSLYILDVTKFKLPEDFKYGLLSFNQDAQKILEQEVSYKDNKVSFEHIKLKDLIFIRDYSENTSLNVFDNTSRIDGIRQVLINTNDSLIAKNIILKSNGKEMITGNGKNGTFPFTPEEKERVDEKVNNSYGLARNRWRTLVTRANLSWKSMHIALRDLGLDESIKVDANIIFAALHIPKDITSLEAKKTTYNNFKESMVSFIQNVIQPEMDYIYQTIAENLQVGGDIVVESSFEHMPIMKFILKEKYEGVRMKGLALKALLDAGLPEEVALEECGFNKKIKIKENGSESN